MPCQGVPFSRGRSPEVLKGEHPHGAGAAAFGLVALDFLHQVAQGHLCKASQISGSSRMDDRPRTAMMFRLTSRLCIVHTRLKIERSPLLMGY